MAFGTAAARDLVCRKLLNRFAVLENEVELGELLLSLNYLPSAGRLNVDIIRAKQLLQTDMSQGSDPFVKIQLVHGLKLTKTKKTSCMRGTIDPFYNESFSFKVPQEELENASLVFTDEVEILGPFPAQTPAWLVSSQNEDKDGHSDNTISELPPTLQNVSPDRRRSSSDASRSTYSLTRRVSSLESRRPSSPLIDIKPIEFGIIGAKKEIVQPTVLRKTYTPDDYFRKFEPRLYSLDSNSDDMDSLTDEEILSKYQLGMLHFSTQYDLLHNYLIVRVIEAKDLPPPISYDGSRQDMAHSNPYVKICLLPDQKNSKQTGVKRKTQNPVFEERYTFEIPFLEAQRRTLLLTVVDFDKFSRHCVIGKVSMPLSDVDLVKGGHWWKALVPSSQEIFWGVLDAHDRVSGQSLVVEMGGMSSPDLAEEAVWRWAKAEGARQLQLPVYGHNVKSSNDFIGRIVIGQYSTGAPESNHWRRMLNAHRTAVEQWHSLRSREECDRVSPASLEVT
ncbi:synaptotagmin-17 [Patagioenas fasciata monilis]|uniref:Synaptotagmin-17 n=1 Tax=Patagioenas fasciata monilis TaxID=372326 RepID=A0A1V4KTR6_PATFA|nr:synaptotagmin-17 [Patagioenas fasciata monilis]